MAPVPPMAPSAPADSARWVGHASLAPMRARLAPLLRKSSGALVARALGPRRLLHYPRLLGAGLVACLGLAALVGLWFDGFGSTGRPVEADDVLFAYAIALLLLGYGALAAVRRLFWVGPATPLRRGVYVLKSDVLVIAEDGALVAPIGSIVRAEAVAPGLRLQLGSGEVRAVAVRSAARVVAAIESLRAAPVEARPAPLEELRALGVEGAPPTLTVARRAPLPVRFASVTALVLCLLAFPVRMVRAHLSDAAAWEVVRVSQDTLVLEEYARSRGAHRDEARAMVHTSALADAEEEGTVAGFTFYIQSYPDSPHIGRARARLYDLAFDEAVAARSVVALARYISDNPGSPRLADARAAIVARYQAVRERYAAQSASPAAAAAIGAMITWLEAHDGGSVPVQFLPPSADSLLALDALLQTRDVGIASVAPVLNPSVLRGHERAVVDSLRIALGATIPMDVLTLRTDRVTAFTEPPGAPVIQVRYEVRPTGRLYGDAESGRTYVGVAFDFDIAFVTPDAPELRFPVRLAPPRRFDLLYEPGQRLTDERVYGAMVMRAFGGMGRRIVEALFAEGTPPHEVYDNPELLRPE